ncbi:probable cytochrome P450 6a13 [Anabrus simplex]|uniref:probable cytochrome P450 6a13 n=1 Tax=Anabrus simplex TaxID=316456 RepID=UPI0035A29828
MVWSSQSFLMEVLVMLLFLLSMLFGFITYKQTYWKRKGVFHLEPQFFFGNFKKVTLLRAHIAEVVRELYDEIGDRKLCGIYQVMRPALIVKDPEILRLILVKDFQNFMDRGIGFDLKNDPLTRNLLFMSGNEWKQLREKLTPAFTSGKIKVMFRLMTECSGLLKDYLKESAMKGEDIDVKEALANFTTDVIGTCAFGLQVNAMSNPNSEFREKGRKIFEPGLSIAVQRLLFILLPNLATKLRLKSQRQDVTDFFLNVVKETVDYREKNNVKRNDFLQMLIELKNKGHVEEDDHRGKVQVAGTQEQFHGERNDFTGMTDTVLAAQVFIFFVAGFETSSTLMSFALYELALNPDVQTRLRDEVDATLQECEGNITYEAVQKMQYLDQVISEVSRKYPAIGFLQRECTTPYDIPGTDVHLDKGTRVIIPVFGLHHDPQYFPDPEKFDPERFSENNKAKRHHYVYLPFGEGPRMCIGMRFGLLQSKVGLVTVLANYEFSVCKDTPIPIVFSPTSIGMSSKYGYKLKITNRN